MVFTSPGFCHDSPVQVYSTTKRETASHPSRAPTKSRGSPPPRESSHHLEAQLLSGDHISEPQRSIQDCSNYRTQDRNTVSHRRTRSTVRRATAPPHQGVPGVFLRAKPICRYLRPPHCCRQLLRLPIGRRLAPSAPRHPTPAVDAARSLREVLARIVRPTGWP